MYDSSHCLLPEGRVNNDNKHFTEVSCKHWGWTQIVNFMEHIYLKCLQKWCFTGAIIQFQSVNAAHWTNNSIHLSEKLSVGYLERAFGVDTQSMPRNLMFTAISFCGVMR